MSTGRATLRMFALVGAAVSLIGCDSIREAAGVVNAGWNVSDYYTNALVE